ncbi:hypothetical protein ACSBR1_011944 [Camellia fascicularis]
MDRSVAASSLPDSPICQRLSSRDSDQTLSRYCKKHNTAGSVLLKYVKFFGTTKSFT